MTLYLALAARDAGIPVTLITEPTAVGVVMDGTDMTRLGPKALRAARKRLAMVFQDPYSSLDPQLNVMVAQAQIMVSYKTYPHVDMRKTGRHAARLLDAVLHGKTQPTPLRTHRPMLGEANSGQTDVPQTAALYDRAALHEAAPGILAGAINAGFAEADIWEAGPTVPVSYDQNITSAAARAIAESLADTIRADRDFVSNDA